MRNLHSINSRNPLSIAHLFHHLRITVSSPLIPCDRSLYITIDNIVHTLTPSPITSEATPHRFHLFLNQHDRLPYLRHIHNVDEQSRYHLEITTSLLETGLGSAQPRRRPMMLTTVQTLDMVTTFTFPAGSG